ncbi:ABC transporter permease [Krasilnikovia sp. MM14-A1259]|uniref:ABC transporter permease n=1 Tax=Krasilnikovia sp. MM14-A1259 TaxID=3373539 RepID=UPI00381FFD81
MTTRKSAYVELVLASSRELFRDGKTAFFVLIFPFFFIAMFLGIGLLTKGGTYHVGVTPGPRQSELVTRLNGVQGIIAAPLGGPVPANPTSTGGNDAIVRDQGDRITVTVDTAKFGAVRPLRKGLSVGGDSRLEFRTTDGSVPFDPIKSALPSALFIALMSASFFGTATPMIALRQRGTLRMLSTTPLSRRKFVLAQMPVRLMLVTAQLLVVCVVAAVAGLLSVDSVAPGLVSGLLGALMLFGFGYLVAARLRNAEVANGLLALLMPVTMLLSGLFLPLDLMPGFLRAVSNILPTTYLVDALSHAFIKSPSAHGMLTDWLVLGLSAAVLATLAAWLFDWDAGDER